VVLGMFVGVLAWNWRTSVKWSLILLIRGYICLLERRHELMPTVIRLVLPPNKQVKRYTVNKKNTLE